MRRVLWGYLLRDLRHEMSYKLAFAMQLVGLLPMLFMFLMLARFFGTAVTGPLRAYGGAYFPFVLIGVSVQAYLSQSLSLFSSRFREAQLTGTLEAEMVTASPLAARLAGMALYPFIVSLFQVFVALGAGSLMGGVSYHWARLPLVLLLLLLSAGAFACLGILAASYIIVFKRGDPVSWIVRIASWMLGGVYFPVAVLPTWMRALADLVPMTHCLEGMRRLLLGAEGPASVIRPMAFLSAWVIVGLPLAYLLFRASLAWSRRRGNLGQY